MLLFLLPHLNRWGSALNLIMKKFIIYLRRNKVNGKCYVGQTCDFKGREYNWRCLKASYSNKYIDEDRAKYGLDNWTVEILGEVDNQEDAWELEQRFIMDYNTLWPNGYNLSKGGSGHNGCKFSDETRKKISEALKGENNPLYGKHHSDETRQKLSESHKGKHHSDETRQKMSENNAKYWLGKHFSDEYRQKLSESHKGVIPKSNPPKTVYQYTLDGKLVKIWPSTNECERNGFNQGNISKCCRGKRKTSNGYKWSYTPL